MMVKKKDITMVSELGTAFSTETNQRDEDVQLLKYIEEGLKKKRGDDETDQEEQQYGYYSLQKKLNSHARNFQFLSFCFPFMNLLKILSNIGKFLTRAIWRYTIPTYNITSIKPNLGTKCKFVASFLKLF